MPDVSDPLTSNGRERRVALDAPFEAAAAERTLPDAFASVARHGDRIAIADDSGDVSFAALDRRSGAVGAALLALDGGRAPVAVLTSHGARAVTAMLGIARAGHVYVVLDALAPNEHLQRELTRTDAVALVVDDAHHERAAALAGGRPLVVLEHVPDAPAPRVRIAPEDPLAITFTSGSSGTPKAVVHSHRNVVHNGLRFAAVIDASPDDRVLVAMPLQFAAASTSVYTALLAGATGCYFALASQSVEGLARFLHDRAVTVVQFSPAHVELLAQHVRSLGPLLHVRLVNVGGDRLGAAQVALVADAFPNASILHRYSTSETNWVAGLVVAADGRSGDELPLGCPVPWVDVRVVDDAGHDVADGVAGELMVRSPYLALGYWGDEQRTGERFVPDGEERWYRSGDRVRRDPEGVLVHVGRCDRTVKVGGTLVDPAAIESCISTLAGVGKVAVVAFDDAHGAVRLAAFLTGRRAPPSDVRRHVAATLPRSMVPQVVIALDDLPRSVRGKVDTAALRELAVARQRDTSDLPEDPTELAVARMYADVLRAPVVGRDDDFFALGGDSLATLELADEFSKEFGLDLDLSVLLEHPTPAALAAWMRSASRRRRHVVRVSSGSDDLVPLVWFAGWGGAGVHNVLPGIRTLSERTSYVVLPHGLEQQAVPDRTIERMAARVVPELLELDPTARFVLVGQSSGGSVAIEIAIQLARRGRRIPLVVLLDSGGPRQPRGRRLRIELEQSRVAHASHPLRSAYRRMRLVIAESEWAYWSWTAGVVHRTGHAQRRAFKALIHVALTRYRGRPYDGRVVLLRASTPLPQYPDPSRSRGWEQFLTGDFEVVEVPGNHNDLLSDHLTSTLAAMDGRLAAVDGE